MQASDKTVLLGSSRSRMAMQCALAFLAFAFGMLAVGTSFAQVNETCFECHADQDLEMERGGQTVSLYVDGAAFSRSVHRSLECTDCHMDIDPDDLPHAEELERVYCGMCHDDAQTDFDASSH